MSTDFALSEDHLAIRDRAREAFAPFRERLGDFRERTLRGHEFPEEHWEAFAEEGFFATCIPEEHGGRPGGLLGTVLGLEAMTSEGVSLDLATLTTMAAVAIGAGGSDELKQEFLPKIARGELKVCVGATEDEAGLNTFRIKTSARQEGDRFIVNGQKIYTSGADQGDYILLIARTTSAEELKSSGLPKTMGLSLFMVDANAPGIRKTAMPVRGEAGLRTFVTEYEKVEVPAANLVGPKDQGAMVLFQMVNPERVLFSAAALGIGEHCLRVACDFAKERVVFRDTPIGEYQAIQHPLADAKVRLELLRLMTYKAAWCHDNGKDPMESGLFANSAKYFAAEAAMKAVDSAIQTLGGRGFNEENHLIHYLEPARLLKSAPVSQEMVLNFVAEHALGLPRSY